MQTPTIVSSKRIKKKQKEDAELAILLRNEISLNLQQIIIDNNKMFVDTSTGYVRPYIPNSSRREAFDITRFVIF